MINEDHPDTTVIAFAVRGAADLWDERMRDPDADLATLLGMTRARIALALDLPATTSGLAADLRLAPSTVSRHLTALAATGLVDCTRRGPLVYYRLTERGCALLDLF
jgi:DNA-binding transcriptional ArsR family regulator